MRLALLALLAVVLAAPRAEAGRGAASLKLLADDTNVVFVFDVARARTSPVFKKGFQIAADKHAVLATLKVDKHVDTIVMGASAGSDKHGVLIVEGKVDAVLAELKKQSTGSETHAGVTYWSTSDGDVAVIDKRLVLASTGDMPAVIARAKNKKRKAPSTVRALLAATSPTSAVFGGVVPDASMRKDISKQFGAEPRHVTLSLGMATKLAIDARFAFTDEAAAEQAHKKLEATLTGDARSQLETMVGKEFSDSLAVDRDGAVTRASATMNMDEIERVVAVARMLM